jgi:hypothetical protein
VEHQKGEYFGLEEFLTDVPNNLELVSSDLTIIYCLNKGDFNRVIKGEGFNTDY